MCRYLQFLTIASLTLPWGNTGLLAATIHVPGDQPTIQAGIDAAQEGDTVLVAPGRYPVNLRIANADVCLTGFGGPRLCFLEPDSGALPIIDISTGDSMETVVTGFTIRKAAQNAAIRVDATSPVISGNIFTDNGGGRLGNNSVIYTTDGSAPLIQRNVFHGNDSAYCVVWAGYGNPATIINNTIAGGRLGVYLYGPGAVLMNNIITACQIGVSIGAPAGGYNDIWGNGVNGPLLPTDISADPHFAGASAADFSLLPGSPCVDAGIGAPAYNDPDGTRNDIGAIILDQTCPTANGMALSGSDAAHVLVDAPIFAWRYYDTTLPEQNGYQVQVGTDMDWTTAEQWDSGPVVSADQSCIYGGAPLADGELYFWRLRVDNGEVSSAWKEAAFQMNSLPAAPTPEFPVDMEPVSSEGVYLSVVNATDAENDARVYEFEIFADPPEITPVASRAGVAEGTGLTSSGVFEGLTTGSPYWWRARCFDGFENSPWSPMETFVIRAPGVIHVPGDQPTIQAGIDAAQEGDTVLVAPGIYAGEGNRDLDFHGVNLVLCSDGIGQATIDCGGSPGEPHRAVYLGSDEDTSSIIEGFIITGAATPGYFEGAITFHNAGGTVRNCLIIGNDCRGVAASSTSPNYFRYRVLVEGCTLQNNWHGIESIANGAISHCQILYNDSVGIHLVSMDTITVTNCLIVGNGQEGIFTETGRWGNYAIANNTIVLNGTGFRFYYEPPKLDAPGLAEINPSLITANLLAANTGNGLQSDGMGLVGVLVGCNNAYGNGGEDFAVYGAQPQPGDTLGNISEDPQFCDLDTAYSVNLQSPCLPANNSCGVLIGAFGSGCGFLCGDVNGDGSGPAAPDLTYLIAHLFRGGPAPAPEPADVDNDGNLDVADLTVLVDYLFRGGPPPVCD